MEFVKPSHEILAISGHRDRFPHSYEDNLALIEAAEGEAP